MTGIRAAAVVTLLFEPPVYTGFLYDLYLSTSLIWDMQHLSNEEFAVWPGQANDLVDLLVPTS